MKSADTLTKEQSSLELPVRAYWAGRHDGKKMNEKRFNDNELDNLMPAHFWRTSGARALASTVSAMIDVVDSSR